jgi:hypothetical protein
MHILSAKRREVLLELLAVNDQHERTFVAHDYTGPVLDYGGGWGAIAGRLNILCEP